VKIQYLPVLGFCSITFRALHAYWVVEPPKHVVNTWTQFCNCFACFALCSSSCYQYVFVSLAVE